jgi:hypothetical protein
MTTITNNKKPSLLNHFKKIKGPGLRVNELRNLFDAKELNNFELESNQVKAILFYFPREQRFNAFKRLVKQFDIKLSAFPEPEIKVLTTYLSRDPAFDNLLPFDKKSFGGAFTTEQSAKRVIPYPIPKRMGNGEACKLNTTSRKNINPPQAAIKRNKLTLAELRLSILQQCPEAESRLKLFNRSEIKNGYQAIITSMKIEEFKNFIEIFPPNDAIKFLNLPMIRDQIEGFQRQKLSAESYIELLNYFKPYQKESVKKLLRPVSPTINTKLLNLGIFKEKIIEKAEDCKKLPDIIITHASR